VKTRAILFAFMAVFLVGCGSGGGDVTTDDVRSKEREIEAATQKLNAGRTPDQGQQGQ